MDILKAKQAVREEMWSRLDRAGVVPPGVHGHIPDFTGAELAAEHLARLPQWQKAQTIKCNPDSAQLPVRIKALTEGKLVYMAVPRIANISPFYVLDQHYLGNAPDQIATSSGAAIHAPKTSIPKMHPVDIVICGSVAVNRKGIRVGKGAGYSDIEVALLYEANRIGPNTIFATTVHDLQVVDVDLPTEPHDFIVNFIVTPKGAIKVPTTSRPTRIDWQELSEEKITSIPTLATRKREEKL
ncbi:5-formyltetrahydrofolate cyclo-ligase [Micromonospora sp. NPDC003197]